MPQNKEKHVGICKVAVLLFVQSRTGKLLSRADNKSFLLDTSTSDPNHLILFTLLWTVKIFSISGITNFNCKWKVISLCQVSLWSFFGNHS